MNDIAVGDAVACSADAAFDYLNCFLSCKVTASNTVTYYYCNVTTTNRIMSRVLRSCYATK